MPDFLVDGDHLLSQGRDEMSSYELNLLAFKTVGKFLASTDNEIDDSHLPDLSRRQYRIPYCMRGRFEELVGTCVLLCLSILWSF